MDCQRVAQPRNAVVHYVNRRIQCTPPSKVACLTVSNALVKSSVKAITSGFVSGMFVMMCSIEISAAVVETDGRNAYWSLTLAGNDSLRCSRGLQRTGAASVRNQRTGAASVRNQRTGAPN